MEGAGDLVELSERVVDAPDPGEALRAAVELRTELEALEVDSVESAVEQGWSWSSIADSLGISKQAAHKRYAKRLGARRRRRRPRARFRRRARTADDQMVVTAQARRAVRAAQIVALALRHAQVEEAHLLLGLLADTDGSAGRALSAIGIEFDAARDTVAKMDLPRAELNGHELNANAAGRVPISAPARAAMEQSLREAARLGHGHLGVEHLLLSLLHDEKGTAVATLAALEVSAEDLERCLGKVLKESEFDGTA